MSVYVSTLLLLLVFLNAEAQPHHKRHGPPHHGGPHHGPHIPLGPLHAIIPKLTEEQRHQLFSELKGSEKATKAEIKAKLDSFVSGLSTELKNDVAQAESKFESMKKKDDEKVKTLSSEAQALYSSIKQVLDDTSITFEEEHQKVHALVEAANQSTVEELRKAHIRMPGIGPMPHGPHGGPHHGPHIPLGPLHAIIPKLTEEQRHQLFSELKGSEKATKAEIKAKLDSFVSGLSTELKNDVAQAESKFESMKKKDDEKVKTLSSKAQTLYSSIKAVLDDTSITFKEEHEKIHALVESANQSTVEELRKAHIRMPGIGPMPHGPHGGPHGHRPHRGPHSHEKSPDSEEQSSNTAV
ncbi:hypothetical protein M3Y94_01244300 [Aphelenchoides besseyi]|nr:hypothetical protein M3Y94_01244300 [Aphelenchoides besseyi]KAI6219356.1 hypothetical protein M3Y95_01102500 [Aphelenchoides besseyi]